MADADVQAPEGQGGKRRIPDWSVLALALGLAFAGALIIGAFLSHQRARQDAHVLITKAQGRLDVVNALSHHEIVMREPSADLVQQIREARVELGLVLDELSDAEAQDAVRFQDLISTYEAGLSEQTRLLAAGLEEEARVLHDEVVHPRFRALNEIVRDTGAFYAEEAERADIATRWGSWVTLFIGAILVGLLAWRLAIARRRTIAMAAQREARFRALVQSASDVILIVDDKSVIVYETPSVESVFGYRQRELLGRSLGDLLDHETGSQATSALATASDQPGATKMLEARLRHRDGSWRDVEIIANDRRNEPTIAATVLTVRDITERKQLEAQLIQSQRMEAVGQLAGGVAHDFNNLLTAIKASASFLLTDLPSEEPLREEAEEIDKATARASSLTQQLLAFSRRQVLEPRVLDPGQIIADVEGMLGRLIDEDIQLVTAIGEQVGRVKADPGQLEQVVMNLAVNARDAMPAGGRLTIETKEGGSRSKPRMSTPPKFMPTSSTSGSLAHMSCSPSPIQAMAWTKRPAPASSSPSTRPRSSARAPDSGSPRSTASCSNPAGTWLSTASPATGRASRSTCRTSTRRPTLRRVPSAIQSETQKAPCSSSRTRIWSGGWFEDTAQARIHGHRSLQRRWGTRPDRGATTIG